MRFRTFVVAGAAIAALAVPGTAQAGSFDLAGSWSTDNRLSYISGPSVQFEGLYSETGNPSKRQGFALRGRIGAGNGSDRVEIRLSGSRTSSGPAPTQAFAVLGSTHTRAGFNRLLIGRGLITWGDDGKPRSATFTGLYLGGERPQILGAFKLSADRLVVQKR